MYSRRLYLKIIAGITAIVCFSLLGAGLLISKTSYFLAFACLMVILWISLYMIRLINRTNRQLSLFFDSLRNKDASQHFPHQADDPFLQNMYAEMNKVIHLLGESRSEIEEKRLYYESILRVLTHEIRNSLTPISSLSADLLAHTESYSPEQLTEGLEVINNQARNLSSFLDSYHRLTHLPDPERKAIAVSALFIKLERLLAAEPGSQRIAYRAEEDLVVQADPNLITLALINLIRNALQAVAGQSDARIGVEALIYEGRTRITITDNGPGIPADKLSDIFIPFYSTKDGGSGIGIPLSQRIMQMHGGELTVISDPRKKTVCTLWF
ncbi:HAMP domain-containing sensor histidine kinase [Parabacteroides sp. PF5-6]|uniref:sensor histidine kinase n=1 Tax=Parabacteroides sp. PF5-6 TaxID=1742403 RepID=UPI00240757BF|nr:HAMP domain-containing sensor histidine kinase [Parabacteroides sp. PF5-6]MDF9830810.1 signal transduction histidine kinase [Parabacteroides sp. PF5-6]